MQIEEVKFLKRKEVEKIEEIIERNYGVKVSLKDFMVFLTSKNKVKIVSKEILRRDLKNLPITSFGLTIGKLKRNNKIHLTIEGAMMCKDAKKNVILLDEENGYKFLRGERFEVKKMINCEKHNFLIVKCGEDVLGSVAYAQEGFRNLLPKSRRIIESIY